MTRCYAASLDFPCLPCGSGFAGGEKLGNRQETPPPAGKSVTWQACKVKARPLQGNGGWGVPVRLRIWE
jgi:hypothetical protein